MEIIVFGKAIADQIDCLSRPGERHEDVPPVNNLIEYFRSIKKSWKHLKALLNENFNNFNFIHITIGDR